MVLGCVVGMRPRYCFGSVRGGGKLWASWVNVASYRMRPGVGAQSLRGCVSCGRGHDRQLTDWRHEGGREWVEGWGGAAVLWEWV